MKLTRSAATLAGSLISLGSVVAVGEGHTVSLAPGAPPGRIAQRLELQDPQFASLRPYPGLTEVYFVTGGRGGSDFSALLIHSSDGSRSLITSPRSRHALRAGRKAALFGTRVSLVGASESHRRPYPCARCSFPRWSLSSKLGVACAAAPNHSFQPTRIVGLGRFARSPLTRRAAELMSRQAAQGEYLETRARAFGARRRAA